MITSTDIEKSLKLSSLNEKNFEIKTPVPLDEIESGTVSFMKKASDDTIRMLSEKPADILIISDESEKKKLEGLKQMFLFSQNPRLEFARMMQEYFYEDKWKGKPAIHPTAVIDPEARIAEGVKIGRNCIIEKCAIGEGSIIHDNVIIHDKSRLGKNVQIYSGCQIGTVDFGYIPLEDENVFFPQIGGVVLEDDVEVFPMTAIGRGTLGDTIIKKGVKIDHLCQIPHNSVVGEFTIITAGVVLAGGSKIGRNCWIGCNAVMKNKTSIGNNVVVGMGAVVTKSFGDDLVVAGNPARILRENK